MIWLAQVAVPDKLTNETLIVLVIFMSFLAAVFWQFTRMNASQQAAFKEQNALNREQDKELRIADRELLRVALERMQENFLQGIKNLDANNELRTKASRADIRELKHDVSIAIVATETAHNIHTVKIEGLHKIMEDNHLATKEMLDMARNMTLLLEDIKLLMQKSHTVDMHGIEEMKQIIEHSHAADVNSIQETMGVLRQLADKIEVNLDQGK